MKRENGGDAMIYVRNAVMEDVERIMEIYNYYVKNTALTTPTGLPVGVVRTLQTFYLLCFGQKGRFSRL